MQPEYEGGVSLWGPSDEKSSCGVGFTSVVCPVAIRYRLPIRQWLFSAPEPCPDPAKLDQLVQQTLLHIEATALTKPELAGLYPLSLPARTQVLTRRLSSPEVVDYSTDLPLPAVTDIVAGRPVPVRSRRPRGTCRSGATDNSAVRP